MARRVDCSYVDTVETRVRGTEKRRMATLEVVNLRVSYQVDVRSRESSEFYSRHHDAQKDRAAVRAEIEVLEGQMSEIRELHATDRRIQAVTSEMLKVDHRRSAEIRELRTVDRTRQQQLIQTLTGQQGPAGGPAQSELPGEAGSSS
ncbi:hypothetical protein Tco_0795498 [Tanacetum coccineum]